jgi:hypothetical protein
MTQDKFIRQMCMAFCRRDRIERFGLPTIMLAERIASWMAGVIRGP